MLHDAVEKHSQKAAMDQSRRALVHQREGDPAGRGLGVEVIETVFRKARVECADVGRVIEIDPSGFDIGISGLPAGLHLLLDLPDGAEHEVLRRAAEAGVALAGMSRLRHPHTPPESPHHDGVVVNFGAPTEHAFTPAVDALCRVLSASGLAG